MPPKFAPARPARQPKRRLNSNGYVVVWAGKAHHLAATDGKAYEHRLVAEAKLGRRLLPGEVVHHVNGDRADNRPENLEVLPGHDAHNFRHRGPASRLRLPGEANPAVACECGCGETFFRFDECGRPRRFVTGHNPEAAPMQDAALALAASAPARAIRAADLAAATGQQQRSAHAVLCHLVRTGKLNRISRGLYGLPE